jgi:prepilin-type N-terminal cleavage/methylation domain-containing protein
MSLNFPYSSRGDGHPATRCAFTLPELMITAAIFSLLVVAGLYSHLLGLKMSTFTQTKLTATHNARAALNLTRDEIRTAKTLAVGYGGSTGFTNAPDGKPHVGNAIQLYPVSNSTNTYVRFYLDTNKLTLNRMVSGKTNIQILANFITNQVPFRIEDFSGNILTNDQNNRVICMTYEFYQFEFAVLQSGKPAFYDYYRLQTKVSRRAVP